jgi:hypothetical protein
MDIQLFNIYITVYQVQIQLAALASSESFPEFQEAGDY